MALVTGAGNGIGRASATAFAREGAAVVVSDLTDSGQETVEVIRGQSGEATFVRCDVSDEGDVRNLLAETITRYGRLDAAHNNAGITTTQLLAADVPAEDFERTISVNLRGVWLCMKYEIPRMLDSGGGAIVNAGSTAAILGLPKFGPYTASKHGVVGLTKSAALDYAASGVRVNVVSPGATRTALMLAGDRGKPGARRVRPQGHSDGPDGRAGGDSRSGRVDVLVACRLHHRAGAQVDGGSPRSDGGRAWVVVPETRSAGTSEQEEVPEPGPHELLVPAVCSLVSAGSEMKVYRGEAISRDEVGLPTTRGDFPLPIKFGYQVVGRVEAEEGGIALRRRRPDLLPAPAPGSVRHRGCAHVSDPRRAEARNGGFCEPLNVALNCHLDVPIRFGDCCVVSGLGMIGRFAAQLARRTAGVLVLVDPLPERRELASDIGADAVVDPSEATATSSGSLQVAVPTCSSKRAARPRHCRRRWSRPGWKGRSRSSPTTGGESESRPLARVPHSAAAIVSSIYPLYGRDRVFSRVGIASSRWSPRCDWWATRGREVHHAPPSVPGGECGLRPDRP